MKIGLISCVKNKVDYKTSAKNLYTSDLFLKSKGYAEKNYDEYYILSALHGLVDAEKEIEPYEYTLIGKPSKLKEEWSKKVFQQIIENIEPSSQIFIFAGNDYRKYLIPLLEEAGYVVEVPLKGLGIGEQKAWYKKQLGV